jgi:ABC-2 type transport system permease protein
VEPLAAPSLAHMLSGFCSLVDKTARSRLIYRFSTLISFVAGGLGYAVFLLVWLEVYRSSPKGFSLSREAMISYLTVCFVLNSTLTLSVEGRFFLRLRQGLITSDLLRPLGFLLQQLAQALGDLLINAMLAASIYAVGFWFLGPSVLPRTLSFGALGAFSALLAFLINFAISYLIVQAAFVLHSGYGIVFTRAALHQVLSGLSAPLVLFPETLRDIARYLPFRHVIETPVRIWLGQVDLSASLSLLLQQSLWCAGLLALGMLVFSAALSRHQIQGG